MIFAINNATKNDTKTKVESVQLGKTFKEKIGPEKIVGPKKVVQKIVLEKILGERNFGKEKNLGQGKFGTVKIMS